MLKDAQKTFLCDWGKKVMNISHDMGWVNYQEIVILEVDLSFK